jgi:L-alanine-DL-glutamate epimerase-like enolase superfamily enzyme
VTSSLPHPRALREGELQANAGRGAIIEYLDVAAAILTRPLRPVDGTLISPSRPGIGIEWDKEAVKRYTV